MNDELNRARFEELMLPLMTDAFNLARWLMRNDEDAEDVVQDAYLKAFRFFGSFRGHAEVRPWLLQIVRNTCYSALAARGSKDESSSQDGRIEEIEDTAPGPHARLESKATVETVRQAIAALPADFREVVVLRELEGLSYKEIAHVAGVPIGTVMSRLSRARDQLHAVLKGLRMDDDV